MTRTPAALPNVIKVHPRKPLAEQWPKGYKLLFRGNRAIFSRFPLRGWSKFYGRA